MPKFTKRNAKFTPQLKKIQIPSKSTIKGSGIAEELIKAADHISPGFKIMMYACGFLGMGFCAFVRSLRRQELQYQARQLQLRIEMRDLGMRNFEDDDYDEAIRELAAEAIHNAEARVIDRVIVEINRRPNVVVPEEILADIENQIDNIDTTSTSQISDSEYSTDWNLSDTTSSSGTGIERQDLYKDRYVQNEEDYEDDNEDEEPFDEADLEHELELSRERIERLRMGREEFSQDKPILDALSNILMHSERSLLVRPDAQLQSLNGRFISLLNNIEHRPHFTAEIRELFNNVVEWASMTNNLNEATKNAIARYASQFRSQNNLSGRGIVKTENYVVQSIVFDKSKFDAKQARKWLREKKYKVPRVDDSGTQLRFRQIDPKRVEKQGYINFVTKPLGTSGISLIIAYKELSGGMIGLAKFMENMGILPQPAVPPKVQKRIEQKKKLETMTKEQRAELDFINEINKQMKQQEERKKKQQQQGKGIMDYGKALIYGRTDLPPKMRKIVEKYGDYQILQMETCRTPVPSILTSALNAVSFGEFSKRFDKLPYDKLFHLDLRITLANPKGIALKPIVVLLEKNEVLNALVNPKKAKDTECNKIGFDQKSRLTINRLLEGAKNIQGDKFLKYSAYDNNCQDFIMAVLKGSQIGTEVNYNFIKQDTKELFRGLPGLRKFANTVTDLGAVANVALTGAGTKLTKF